MTGERDPLATFAAFWEASARVGLESAQAMAAAAAGVLEASAADPLAVAARTQQLLASLLGAAWAGLPVDALGRLADLGYGPAPGPLPRFAPSDLTAEPAGLRALLDEVAADLGALPPDAFAVDLGPVSDAVAAALGGRATPRQEAIVRDLLAALAVKARLGPEVYADPATPPPPRCPRDEVVRTPDAVLFRYRRDSGRPARGAPVLIVYSVINRPYILDLLPSGSFVRHLLDRDLDVFLVEWTPIDDADAERTLDRTIAASLPACLDAVQAATGAPAVSLFGHCVGGTFAALLAARERERVDRVLFLTTPFRAADAGVVSWLTDARRFPVADIVAAHGRMPKKLIRHTFLGLKPYYELTKWRLFVETLGDPLGMEAFLALDRWSNDNVDVPAGVFRPFVQDVLQSRRLLLGRMEIAGEPVDLAAIRRPMLNVYARHDWIVRPDAALALGEALPADADCRHLDVPGGHLTLLLDARHRPRWDELSGFLLGASA